MEALKTVGHAKYVGSMSPDGYPGSPTFETEVTRPVYGWAPLASQVPLGNDDYTQRVISSSSWVSPTPPFTTRRKVTLNGEDFVVSQDIRDYRTGPFSPGPGGEVIVERVRG